MRASPCEISDELPEKIGWIRLFASSVALGASDSREGKLSLVRARILLFLW
jgi:hypothetical protein